MTVERHLSSRHTTMLKSLAAFLCLTASTSAFAADSVGPDPAQLKAAREKAVAYLKSSQAADGTWTSPQAGGISALCIHSLLLSGVPADDPTVAKGLTMLAGLAQPDGSICSPKSRTSAYETSIAVMTLVAANESDKYTPLIEKAEKFLRGTQFDESKGIAKDDPKFGGAGYGPNGGRPDLSNTTFFTEALKSAGVSCDDPAMKNALVFISRCQNLESEFNTTANAAKVNDGGFLYTAAAGGNSPAGKTDEGGLRSYGSMTYAGFKSMLHAGLTPDDVRVKAALEWIRKHYTVSENPGMGANGLYYYHYLFAKALGTLDQDHLEDEAGGKHDWRKELAEHLIAGQQKNGSWMNTESDRWFEGDPNLVTAYVLTALDYCERK
jgi:squalene-hopene/tetraprenyl-beta-curcumene cyclase